jgi:uncharacterized PurR-regulated membrane protein YhhQ (DUF165 family)
MSKTFLREASLPVIAFGLIVLASNILVQYPVRFLGLEQYLTYGAFSYPVAFLVTDIANRHFGARLTRRIVAIGFVIAVILSLIFATPRIALASGFAFLAANLLDVQIFDKLREKAWWLPPLGSSLISSALDTVLFFSIAFAGVGPMSAPVDLFGHAAPLWAKLAVFDYFIKLGMAMAMVLPYGAIMPFLRPARA